MLTKDKIKLDKTGLGTAQKLPKTIVIGATGLLGPYFLEGYRKIYPDSIGTSSSKKGPGILRFDLLQPDIRPLNLKKNKYKEGLILAGIFGVPRCEDDKVLTRKANIEGTLELIRQLTSEGIKPIFASSDQVFDGETGNYTDDSPTNPITEYGRQKAEVESRIKEIAEGDYLVIRLSKMFSLKKGDGTLFDEMAREMTAGKAIKAAYDHIFCPTLISDLVKAVTVLQSKGATGIINVCSPKPYSRYELALELAGALRVGSDKVSRISLDEFRPKRPKNTSMQIRSLLSKVKCSFTPMPQCIKQVAKNYKEGIS